MKLNIEQYKRVLKEPDLNTLLNYGISKNKDMVLSIFEHQGIGFKRTKKQKDNIEEVIYQSFVKETTRPDDEIVKERHVVIMDLHNGNVYIRCYYNDIKGEMKNMYYATIKPNGYILKRESNIHLK